MSHRVRGINREAFQERGPLLRFLDALENLKVAQGTIARALGTSEANLINSRRGRIDRPHAIIACVRARLLDPRWQDAFFSQVREKPYPAEQRETLVSATQAMVEAYDQARAEAKALRTHKAGQARRAAALARREVPAVIITKPVRMGYLKNGVYPKLDEFMQHLASIVKEDELQPSLNGHELVMVSRALQIDTPGILRETLIGLARRRSMQPYKIMGLVRRHIVDEPHDFFHIVNQQLLADGKEPIPEERKQSLIRAAQAMLDEYELAKQGKLGGEQAASSAAIG